MFVSKAAEGFSQPVVIDTSATRKTPQNDWPTAYTAALSQYYSLLEEDKSAASDAKFRADVQNGISREKPSDYSEKVDRDIALKEASDQLLDSLKIVAEYLQKLPPEKLAGAANGDSTNVGLNYESASKLLSDGIALLKKHGVATSSLTLPPSQAGR